LNRSGASSVYRTVCWIFLWLAFLGAVGLDWQFAGVAPAHGPGTSDLILRNVNTGQFEVYNRNPLMLFMCTFDAVFIFAAVVRHPSAARMKKAMEASEMAGQEIDRWGQRRKKRFIKRPKESATPDAIVRKDNDRGGIRGAAEGPALVRRAQCH
jgi:hypothetical protein